MTPEAWAEKAWIAMTCLGAPPPRVALARVFAAAQADIVAQLRRAADYYDTQWCLHPADKTSPGDALRVEAELIELGGADGVADENAPGGRLPPEAGAVGPGGH